MDGGRTDYLRVEALEFLGPGNDVGMGVRAGVFVQSNVQFRYCAVIGFNGHGMEVLGQAGATPPTYANYVLVDNCWFEDNAQWGFYIHGDNANNGTIINCVSKTNIGGAFWDSSQAGSVYISPRISGPNGDDFTEAFKIDANQSVIIAAWVEGNLNPSVVPHPALVLGGNLEAFGIISSGGAPRALAVVNALSVSPFTVTSVADGLRAQTTLGVDNATIGAVPRALECSVPEWNPLAITSIDNAMGVDMTITTADTLNPLFATRMVRFDCRAGGTPITDYIPSGNYTATLTGPNTFTINQTGTGVPPVATGIVSPIAIFLEDSAEYSLRYYPDEGQWRLICAGNSAFILSGTRAPLSPGYLSLPIGYFLGNSTDARFITLYDLPDPAIDPPQPTDPSPRSDGGYVAGDRILARTPGPGLASEWVCIADGAFDTSTWAVVPLPGQLSPDMEPGDKTLSISHASRALIAPSGSLTSARTLYLPAPGDAASTYERTMRNMCTDGGGGSLTIKITGDPGPGVPLPFGEVAHVGFATTGAFRVGTVGTTIDPASPYLATAGERIALGTGSVGNTVNLPAAPNPDDYVQVINMSGGNVTVSGNGNTIYVAGGSDTLADDGSTTYWWVGGGIAAWKRT